MWISSPPTPYLRTRRPPNADFHLPPEKLPSGRIEVSYDETHVWTTVAGNGESPTSASMIVEFDAEVAEEIAAALYMAAEEQQRRPWGEA